MQMGGVACVLQLWTGSKICSLPAQAEEQLHEGVDPHTVHWQLSDRQTNQNQLLVQSCCNVQ
ncbi:hypothetical protein PAMP_007500 [Pampus punctatissimus]